jgi:uncharacterized membrane protein YeiH
MLGVTTGVAGGILRDLLIGEIPLVFRREIYLYATAAFGGAVAFVLLNKYTSSAQWNAILGTLVTLLLRLAGIKWRIRLPMFRPKVTRCRKTKRRMAEMNTNEIISPATANDNSDPRLWPVATVMATGIFATTFVQLQGLGYLPFNHLLTNMGLDSDKSATFFSLSMLPWTFKVIAGLFVDGVPLFGSRRRAYLLLSALSAAAMWLWMGWAPSNYNLLLILAIGMNTAIVFGSTTSGGLLVEAGQRFNASGPVEFAARVRAKPRRRTGAAGRRIAGHARAGLDEHGGAAAAAVHVCCRVVFAAGTTAAAAG